MNNLQQEFLSIDEIIKSGDLKSARIKLKKLYHLKVDRKFIFYFANLCRRAQLPKHALKLLKPFVHPRMKKFQTPSNAERAEYAASLVALRLTNEALDILNSISNRLEYSKTLLIESSTYQAMWDYKTCMDRLKQILDSKSEMFSEHDILIAQVNLADCFIHLKQSTDAIKLLNTLCEITFKKALFFTHGKCLELLSRIYLYEKKYSMARQFIKKALQFYKDKNSFEYFLARKQLFIISWHILAIENNSKLELKKKFDDKFHSFCMEAISKSYFESLRDLWIEWSKIHQRQDVFKFIMHGSPQEGIRDFFNDNVSQAKKERTEFMILSHYPFEIDENGPSKLGLLVEKIYDSSFYPSTVFNVVATASIENILTSLTCDFFRPKSLYDIINDQKVNQRNGFNNSAINLAHQNIYRLRRWLKRNSIPVCIVCKKKKYYLKNNQNTGSVLIKLIGVASFYGQLRSIFGDHTFTKSELVKKFPSYSPRTISREIEQILKNNDLLIRKGKSKNTYYQFMDTNR